MQPPCVFDYDDYRHFLEDWFEHRKATNPRFSHRAFARKVGSSDPSVLRNIISGRRPLSTARIDSFCAALTLDPDQEAYFRALVDLAHAPHDDVRRHAGARLAELRRQWSGPNVAGERLGYLSRWYFPAIVELSRVPGFRAHPAWVSARLSPSITEATAADALQRLTDWGYLARTPDGWHPSEPHRHTDVEVDGRANMGQHHDLREISGAWLERVGEGDRAAQDATAFLTMTVAIPSERMSELRQELFRLTFEMAELAEGLDGDPDRVIQLQVQAFPLTKLLS